jgi:molybdopterin-guanine dinucleotide biosynthesis protein A
VAVLAVDMPEVTSTTFERLLAALDDRTEGVVLVDGTGRRQPLCALYRRTALERARPADRADEHGLSVRRLVGSMRLAEVPAVGAEAQDVDTWQDLHGLRTRSARINLDT